LNFKHSSIYIHAFEEKSEDCKEKFKINKLKKKQIKRKMFKRMATSVKTAIQSNKQQQQQQQLDDAQIPNDRTVSLIRDRNKAEKEFDRKNQRSKIVNENRLNKNAFSSSSTNVASSTQTTHGTMKKASSDLNLSKCNYSMSDQGTDRRKLLEQWRKNRQLTKTSSIKDTQRPVFKVQHLTSRFFDSKSMVDLSSIRNVIVFCCQLAYEERNGPNLKLNYFYLFNYRFI
jgi:hypothetical protein